MVGENEGIVYEFGGFRLDPSEHSLVYLGVSLPLTPKAFETLAVLVERSGHVVTKDELMQLVWPDSFVEESGLTRNISVLRKMLERSPGGKDFIETIPKIGYRFAATVIARQRNQEGTNESTRTPEHEQEYSKKPGFNFLRPAVIGVLCLGIVVGAIAGYIYFRPFRSDDQASGRTPRLLAVLPFKPLATNSTDHDLEIGIADALITRLSNLRELIVKPTAAVRKYANTDTDPTDAGRELGVEAVIDGGIQLTGDRILVTVQLVRVSDGASLWAQRFEERHDDIFAIQDVIAEHVAEALKVRMDAEEQNRLLKSYTENTEAFAAYLKGRNLLSQYTRESTLAAIDAFEDSLTFDPNYALARDGLATASAEMYLRYAGESESSSWADRADLEIEKALSLDPDLAETHQALAAVYRKKDFNWEKVLDEGKRALELNPSLEQAHYYRAAAFYHLGLLDNAMNETALAEKINPQNRIDSLRTRGVIALFDGRYPDAVSALEEVQRLSSKPISDPHLALAYFYNGDVPRAKKMAADLSSDESASASSRALAVSAVILAVEKDRGAALKVLTRLEQLNSVDHHAAYSVGVAFAQLGDMTKAMYWLKRAISTGLRCYRLFATDRYLETIKTQREFVELLTELQTAEADARRRFVTQ